MKGVWTFLHILCVAWFLPLIRTETVIGTITDDTNFYHVNLNKYPAVSAKIKFVVRFPKLCCPGATMDIYTREDDWNLKNNCSANTFGQLRNEDLFRPLRLGEYRGSSCFLQTGDRVKCIGDISIQDYVPTYFSASFGFRCSQKDHIQQSLKGLQFNISIYGLTNITRCTKMPQQNEENLGQCSAMIQFTTYPNLIGNWSQHSLIIDHVLLSLKELLSKTLSAAEFPCHKFLEDFICHSIFPKCNPNTGVTEHVCREMCEELEDVCLDAMLSVQDLIYDGKLPTIAVLFQPKKSFTNKDRFLMRHQGVNCGYLPSYDSGIPCYYKQVTCQGPPVVKNGKVTHVTGANKNGKYDVNSTVVFSCTPEEHTIQGNATVICLYSGEWSVLPNCSGTVVSPVQIIVTVFTIPVVLFVALALYSIIHCFAPTFHLIRKREYDAFVCFQFDKDNDFVMNVLVPKLEHKYKLFIHSLDFKPGAKITANILTAIESSNSAILILSNVFLKSGWCRQEFEYCYGESKNDPAFKLLVILTETTDQLELSNDDCRLISYFLKNNTYLVYDDKKLWNKIGTHLLEVKGEKKTKNQAKLRTLEKEEEAEQFLEEP